MVGKHRAPHPFIPRPDTSPRCPPTQMITYMRGGGLRGSCSLEHGWLEVMEAWVETRHPLGSARGSRLVGPHKPFPSLQGGGGGVYKQGPGGAVVGTFPKSFPVALGLALPPLTHHPLLPPAPHAAPQGAGVPEWNHVSGEELSYRARAPAGVGVLCNRRESLPGRTPPGVRRVREVRRGQAGWGRGDNPLAPPDPGPLLPSAGPRRRG